jgi:succinate-semialdehyde dehydrogenase / glutarate-semialdehyde dehydrogenase
MAAKRPVIDPRTGTVLEQVCMLPPSGVAEVARTAATAWEPWAQTPLAQRCRLVAALADALAEMAPALAQEYSREQGKTVAEAGTELTRAQETLRWAAACAGRAGQAAALADRDGLTRAVLVEPVGPVLAVVPWNFPAVVLARKLGPALVMGCTVAVKGPEQTPRLMAGFAAAAERTGLPAGVMQIVAADPAETRALVERPEFRHVTFTGSSRVGRLVATAAAANLTRCTLELGGHAPAIVMADADLDLASARLTAAKFGSAGQSCSAPSRFLVARSICEPFVRRLVAAAPVLDNEPAGTNRPAARMGPLQNGERQAAVHALVVDAVAGGARLRLGGVLPTTPGYYYPATVLTDVPEDARIMAQEPFGPVAPVLPYDDEEQAVALANSTTYALCAYVFGVTRHATSIAGRLNAGSVSINSAPGAAPDAPLGGRDASGYGYEGGTEGLLAFTSLKLRQHASTVEIDD